jgi:hypothetical protein
MKKTLLILISILSIHTYAQIPTAGMIAGYAFNGNANDESGNGHNGTVYGATLTTNRLGTPNAAYSFNGTSNYIRVPNGAGLTPATTMTICAEVKPMGFYAGNCQGNAVVSKGYDYTNGHYTLMFTDNHYDGSCSVFDSLHENFKGEFGSNTSANANYLYSPYIVSNTWYCAITTFDGSSVKTYIDGTLKTSYPATNALVGDTTALFIGAYGANLVQFPYWFKGVIDDVRIYNRVLTNIEIQGYCSVLAGIEDYHAVSSHVTINTLGSGIYELVIDRNYIKTDVTIRTVLGQQVYSGRVSNNEKKVINLSSFAKGIYLLNIVTEEGQYTTKLFKE